MSKKFNGQYTQIGLKYNVTYKHTDKDGNIKKLFAVNSLGRFVLDFVRKFVKEPIDSVTGQVKAGYANHIAAYGFRNSLFGSWVDEMTISNLVVSAGKAGVASRINGAGSEAVFASIGQGVGVTGAAAGDTALGTEKDASNGSSTVHVIAAATASRVTTTVTNDTAQLVGTVSELATMAITESGVFNATTAGTMLCRQTFSAINVISSDLIQFTWKIACA